MDNNDSFVVVAMENELEDNNTTENLTCSGGATEQQLETYHVISFWIDIVANSTLAAIGIVANAVIFPILCRWVKSSDLGTQLGGENEINEDENLNGVIKRKKDSRSFILKSFCFSRLLLTYCCFFSLVGQSSINPSQLSIYPP